MRQDGKKTKKCAAERLQRTAEESAEKKSAKNAHCKYKNSYFRCKFTHICALEYDFMHACAYSEYDFLLKFYTEYDFFKFQSMIFFVVQNTIFKFFRS